MKKMGKILLIYKKSDVKCQMQKIWRRKMQKIGKSLSNYKNLLNAKNSVFCKMENIGKNLTLNAKMGKHKMQKIWKHKIGKILPRSKRSGVKCKMQKIGKHKMQKMGKILLSYKKYDVKCQMQKIWRRKLRKIGKSLSSYKKSVKRKK